MLTKLQYKHRLIKIYPQLKIRLEKHWVLYVRHGIGVKKSKSYDLQAEEISP